MTSINDLAPDKVVVFGDVHGNFFQVVRALDVAQREMIDVLVQVGDLGIWHGDSGTRFLDDVNDELEKRDMWLFFVDGNHENFDILYSYDLNRADGTRPVRSRIIHLPRGLRWEWSGHRFGALGGAHSVDRQWRKEDVSWWPEEWVSDSELQSFAAGGPVDILFMHDSPEGAPNMIVDSGTNTFNFPIEDINLANMHRKRLAEVVNTTSPALIMHGHYHKFMQGTYKADGANRFCDVIGLDEGSTGYTDKFVYVLDITNFEAPAEPFSEDLGGQ